MSKITLWMFLFINLWCVETKAQYFNLYGNNQDVEEYINAAPENADTPLMYIFYNNVECDECATAIRLIYNLYTRYYADDFNIFEINYANADYDYQNEYNLTQPLTVVLVSVANGRSTGYYKMDIPQQWLENGYTLEENLFSRINNFLMM